MIEKENEYRAALYCRLSSDDAYLVESGSIQTQKALLTQYCRENNIPIYDTYADDGFSGTNFERPDFKRMLGDLEKHKANVVIVKDLSRFGREYAQMGMYIENDFEDWNIRFISIGENIDTLNGTDVILMPIINVINSHYPRTKCPNSQRTNRKNRSPRKRNNQWRKNQTVDMYYKFVGEQGNIYWKMGDKLKAAEFYYDYIAATDSVRTKELQNSATEFSSILELEQLKNERNELQLSVQKDQLHTVYLVLIFVVLFWIMGGILFFRIYKLNKRLKASELIVNKQNKDLKIFADELMKAKERAEYASMMKTTFIQNMSHEIRTPLNSIVGFSQLLVDIYQDNQETKEFVSIIEVNSANLLRLINDVLDISFLDQSEEVPYDKVEDINVSCLSGIEAVRTLVHEGVELEFRPSVERCLIKTNPGRVSQILIHLLQNAAKFTDKGSIVLDYELNRNEREIIYRITDTGKGIPADKQEYVFERFTKLDDFTQGTGLGLSICRLIAEKLGGTLVVDKEYTVGCRFILTLPLIEV